MNHLAKSLVIIAAMVVTIRLIETNHPWWTILPNILAVAFAYQSEKLVKFNLN